MVELNEEKFDEVINSGKTVVIDFWAAWCNPCKMMAPNFEDVASELCDKFDFYKFNVDTGESISIKYNIYSIPTILVFKNGKEIARNVGFLNKNGLKTWLKTQN